MKEVLLVDIPTCTISANSSYEKIAEEKYRLQKIIFDDYLRIKNPSLVMPHPKYYSRSLLTFASCLKEEGIDSAYFNMDSYKINDPFLLPEDFDKLPMVEKHWESIYVTAKHDLIDLAENSDIMAIASITPSFPIASGIADLAKRSNESIKIIIGGRHATYFDRKVLKNHNFDVVIRGEGDESFTETVGSLLNSSTLEKVKGITYKDKERIVRNPPRAPIQDLDKVPLPLYDILPGYLGGYHHNIVSARGCPFSCDFCQEPSFWQRKTRMVSPERFVEELSYLNEHTFSDSYPLMVHISDSDFNAPKERASEICQLIKKENINLKFSCDIHPKFVDKKIIKDMEKAGFLQLGIGIEDASDRVLRSVNKSSDFNTTIKACEKIKETAPDIRINAYWITGLPGSNKETFDENIKALRYVYDKGLVDIVSNKHFVPYPGTPIFDSPEKFGVEILHKEWGEYERLSRPVMRLKDVNEKEIFEQFLKMETELISLYEKRIERDNMPSLPEFEWKWNQFFSCLVPVSRIDKPSQWSYATKYINQGKQTLI